MAIAADGVRVLSVAEGLFYKFAGEIEYAEGNCIPGSGQVVDISGDTPTLAGQFDNDYNLYQCRSGSGARFQCGLFPEFDLQPWLAYCKLLIRIRTQDRRTGVAQPWRLCLGALVSWGGEGKLAFITRTTSTTNTTTW